MNIGTYVRLTKDLLIASIGYGEGDALVPQFPTPPFQVDEFIPAGSTGIVDQKEIHGLVAVTYTKGNFSSYRIGTIVWTAISLLEEIEKIEPDPDFDAIQKAFDDMPPGMSGPFDESQQLQIDPSIHVTETGAYFLVAPAPAFQEQLDRIEAMLAVLMPKKEEVPVSDFDPESTLHYLLEVEPGCGTVSFLHVNNETIIRTDHLVSTDTQDWIKSQFRETITFEVVG